jgi:hypothetical protein
VIATGFSEKKEVTLPGKVVDLPKSPRHSPPGSAPWRRRVADVRADSGLGAENSLEADLDVPAFLRRQAD